MLISPLVPDSRQNLRQQGQVAWKSEHEQALHVREDREYTHIRGLPASLPSSSRPYRAQDYHVPPSTVRTPVPPRPAYDDNYNKPYAPPTVRHVNDPNPYASGAPSHFGSYLAVPPSRTYNFHEHPSPPLPLDEDNHEYQQPGGAQPLTNDDSEKPEPARLSRQPHPPHEVTRLDAEEQDRHREEEWRRKMREVHVKEEEVRRKEEEVAKQAEGARRRDREVQRKAEEARLEKEEAQRKAEEARRMGEEAQRKAEEARVKEEEAQRKEAEARRMQEEMARREYEAHTPRRPYSFPPAMLSNRRPSYPQPSHFRNPSPARRTIATSSARNEEDVALRLNEESSLAVAVNTHAHLLKVPAVSDSRFESESLDQPEAESHPGPALDMGTTKPEASSSAASNMALEHNQFLSGAQNTTIVGGTFATVTGNMIINTTESSGKQLSAINDDEDANAQSMGDLSLQSTRPAYASAPLLKKHGPICASCLRRLECSCCACYLCYSGIDGTAYDGGDRRADGVDRGRV